MSVSLVMLARGLTSVKVGAAEMIYNPPFLPRVVSGRLAAGRASLQQLIAPQVNAPLLKISESFGWCQVITQYAAAANKISITVDVHNIGSSAIEALWLYVLGLKFPGPLKLLPGQRNQLGIDSPTSIFAPYGNERATLGTVALCNEDVGGPPLIVGFREASALATDWYVQLAFESRPGALGTNWPAVPRSIAPQSTDTYTVSLRFGAARDTEF